MAVILHRLALLALQVLVLWVEGGVESRLKSVAVDDAEVLEHHQTSCCFFVLFVCKLAVAEREETVFLREEVWQDLDEVVVFVLVNLALARDAPIHEYIALATVTMHVTEEHHLVFFVVRGH